MLAGPVYHSCLFKGPLYHSSNFLHINQLSIFLEKKYKTLGFLYLDSREQLQVDCKWFSGTTILNEVFDWDSSKLVGPFF